MEAIAHSSLSAVSGHSRHQAALGAVAISLLAALALAMFSTEQAVGGSLLERATIPARMLLLVVAATLLLRWSGVTWQHVGLRRPSSLWRTAGLVVAGYAGIALTFTLMTQVLMPLLGVAPKTLSLFAAVKGNTAEYLYWLVPVAWGSAAFGEELVFRGYLQGRLQVALERMKGATCAALILQAAIFGALHSYQGIGGALLAGSTGLILGVVYLAGRKNLWAPIILHGLVDTVSLSAVFLGVASKVA
jgi:uncharacterized protein